MAEVITMLALSPTMDEGTLAEWTIKEGDVVEEGQVIAEVETDKATMEMESFFEGTLLKLLVAAGDAVPVGDAMAIVGEAGEDISALLKELEGGGAAAPAQADEAPAEELPAEDAADDGAAAAKPAKGGASDGRVKSSPLARRMAEDAGIELSEIEGSGPSGRVIKRDVEAAMESQGAKKAAPAPKAASAAASADGLAAGTQVPLSQMRKTIAKRLQSVWQSTPHFTLTMDIDMAAAMAKRKEINAGLKAANINAKVSVNDMIVKACAVALQEYPAMNVSYQDDHLLQFDEVHVGVAVAIEEGLITPTIRFANEKGLRKISEEVRELAGRAQDKKLKPEEYTGGTFTVSNLGMFGIDHFMAIINPPQAGILACGAVKKTPVVNDDGELEVGTRMKVTLSCDHRAVDGATGAEFLTHVKRLLETPLLLMV
ncbi:pyruvate dehydrogenase complex dihydrolipoamide acetyltransferase [Bradymonas sediminis]|uniref:Acetyltransferase component of pyruvate dehydrogenase complex n=1 Tax=Bradymonas sediminis TaxID=1548548 RepID=A0A2Z4FP05_9DELT|nr:pyruvate dehydrogenase complex dihydrolipoamide acetyltransferase [Bradymonas sediminis]AWV90465.1 pyruvate dehydrogenase complex dihydrolipoamide acetyltransferase [Bradymonas sediminis]TDP72149.1 pyruvate dehydrogenase E2 component (dihydrolipoamide acetyltransferase) [Bradymonas sediminis]